MNRQAGAADVDGVLMLPGAPVFFGELREGDGRRILLDPAPKVCDSRIFRHAVGRCKPEIRG